MQINSTMVLGAVVVAGLLFGAYSVGVKHGEVGGGVAATSRPGDQAAPVKPGSGASQPPDVAHASPPAGKPAPLAPGAQLPDGHRPFNPLGQPLPLASGAPPHSAPAAATQQMTTPSGNKVRFTHFRVGNRNVKDMLVDGQFLWVGTSGGVIRYDTQGDDYRLFDVRGGNLVANGVFHVGRLNNSIAVGTYGGGLSMFDPATDKWESFNIPHGLADAFVYDTLQTADGDIWIATWSGANRIKGGDLQDRSKWETFTVENTQGGLPNDWVYGLAAGKNGEVWMATEGGLARYLNGQWSHWTHKDGLGVDYDQVKDQNPFENDPAQVSSHHARQKQEQGLGKVTTAYNPNYIISLVVDSQGAVWCGTWGGGLARFDGSKWTNMTKSDGLPSNYIFMLHTDQHGKLWVGTSGGLARREDQGQWTVLNTNDGLFSDNVFSMAMAADGAMWVGSFGGVARIYRE